MRSNFSLSPEQREDARRALMILDGSGISLAAAAERALNGTRAQRSVTFAEAGTLFLAARRTGGARPKTLTWYEEMLSVVARDHGERKLDDFTRPLILKWIRSRKAGSQMHFFRVVRALFRWAAVQEVRLVGVDPTAGVELDSITRDKTIRFLSVAEAEAVLRKDIRHRPAHALSLFAGIRPEEIAGEGKTWLPWDAINEAEQIIRIPPECAKTRRARLIEGLSENGVCRSKVSIG